MPLKGRVAVPYARLPRVKGAWGLRVTSVVAGLPVAMFSLATLVVMALRQYSYPQMGDVLATGLVGRAVLLPVLAAMADRYGPRRVLIPQMLVFCVATVALMQDAEFFKPISVLYVAGAIAGATLPTAGAPVRTAWAALGRPIPVQDGMVPGGTARTADDPMRRAVALEWSSIADIALLGPLLTMLLVETGHPRGGLIGAAAFAFFGVIGLALQPSVGRAGAAGRGSGVPSALGTAAARPGRAGRTSGVIALALIAMALIALLSAAAVAAIEISTVAAVDRYGHHALSGLFLALAAVGCFASGLWNGWPAMPARRRLVVALLLVVIATTLLWLAPGLALLPVSLFLLGVFARPAITGGYAILADLIRPGRLSGALSWYGCCLCLGAAAGVAAAGDLIGPDAASGPAGGFRTAAAFAVMAALVSLGARQLLGKPGRHVKTGRPGSAPELAGEATSRG